MLPILIVFLTFVFAVAMCYLRCPKPVEPREHPMETLRNHAGVAIVLTDSDLTDLGIRYCFMWHCLANDNPRIWGLGPVHSDPTTFHIHEGVTRDMVEGMIELIAWAKRDLDIECEFMEAFWDEWVRTGGDMPGGEVSRAVEMMAGWRDGEYGAVAREVVAEAEKYFTMDDGIEAGGFTIEQAMKISRTGGESHCRKCPESE